MWTVNEVIRPYRGVSASDRRSERRERLVEAGLDVVGRDGVPGATVDAVCTQARLTKRYFYESFSDLGALLEEMLGRFHSGLEDDIRAALGESGDEDPLARARMTVRLLVSAMDDARLARLYAEAAAHPRLQALRQEAYEVYSDLVLAEVFGLGDPSPAERVRALAFVTGTTQVVIDWLQDRIDVDGETLVSELAAVAVG